MAEVLMFVAFIVGAILGGGLGYAIGLDTGYARGLEDVLRGKARRVAN